LHKETAIEKPLRYQDNTGPTNERNVMQLVETTA